MPDDSFPRNAGSVCAVIFGAVAGALAYQQFGHDISITLIGGFGVAWLIFSGVFFVSYAAACCDYGGMSLIWLPWGQPWVWVFFLFTLPWLPFWVISLARLLANRKKVRPSPLPIED